MLLVDSYLEGSPIIHGSHIDVDIVSEQKLENFKIVCIDSIVDCSPTFFSRFMEDVDEFLHVILILAGIKSFVRVFKFLEESTRISFLDVF